MNLKEILSEVEKNLQKIGNLKNIRVHSKEPFYIEFKLPDKKTEQSALNLYQRLSERIRNNYSQISVCYNNPHFRHEESHKRRISINFEGNLKTDEKLDLLKNAAMDLNGILKRCLKYGFKS